MGDLQRLAQDTEEMRRSNEATARQHEIAQFKGDRHAIENLDNGGLEQLIDVLKNAQERAWKRLKLLQKDDKLCKVCFGCDADAVLLPCGHLILCYTCAGRVARCPTCRTPCTGFTKVF